MPKEPHTAGTGIGGRSNQVLRTWMVRLGLNPEELSPLGACDDEIDAIENASAIVMSCTMIPPERLVSLWTQVRYLDRVAIAGAMVECGVWKGGAAGMMALAHRHGNPLPTRELHLFDSWEGLPEPRAGKDGRRAAKYASGRASGALKSIGQCVSSAAEVAELLEAKIGYPQNLLHYYQGWFQETLAKNRETIGAIALLRLDGDWYDSTKICLEELYPQVSKGGIVVIDDYSDWAGCRAAVDEYVARLKTPIRMYQPKRACPYWIKPE